MLIKELRIDREYSKYYQSSMSSWEDPEESDSKPAINKKVLATPDLLKRLNKSFAPRDQNVILPRNCRYVKKISQSYTAYIIEQDPELRTVIANVDVSGALSKLSVQGKLHEFGYENHPHGKRKNKFLLAFPFIEYIMTFSNNDNALCSLMVFLRHLPLQGMGDLLYKVPLYNIPGSQSVCLGGYGRMRGEHINESIQYAISRFWNTTFNEDYVSNVAEYADDPFVGDLLSWQHYTKVDPMFVYNVEWIPYKSNLNEILDELQDNYGSSSSRVGNYGVGSFNQIVNLFSRSEPTSNQGATLYDNITNYISLGQDINLFTEDSIIIKNKRFFILSFLGDNSNGSVTHARLVNPSGKKILFKLTEKAKDFLLKKLQEERHVISTSINGEEIKAGDILEIEDSEGVKSYKKLHYMRYSFDGRIEAKMGTDFYVVENIKSVRHLNLSKPTVDGIKLNNRTNYLVVDSQYSGSSGIPSYYVRPSKYGGITVSQSGHLQARFHDKQLYETYTISYTNNLTNKLYMTSKMRPAPRIFRMGSRLYNLWNSYKKEIGEDVGFFHPTDGLLRYRGYAPRKPDFKDAISNILINDKNTLRVESFDMDLEFSVGDTVIAVDWDTPQQMKIPKTIVGFKINEELEELYVVLKQQDSDKETYEHLFIDYDRSAFIKVGTLRHIESSYDGISAGTMIKANKPRIANFPQKDINMVVGFITDTGGDIPLVLCSNCCTIWPDQLKEDFDIIPEGDSKLNSWVPGYVDISKMKLQPGDIITYGGRPSDPMILHSNQYNRGMKTQFSSEYVQRISGYTFDNRTRGNSKPFGLLTPRYTQTQWMGFEKAASYPNFHGMFTRNRLSGMLFDLDERRYL